MNLDSAFDFLFDIYCTAKPCPLSAIHDEKRGPSDDESSFFEPYHEIQL